MLERLKEVVSETCYNEIMSLIEGLFVNDGREDLFDKISQATSGKTLKQYMGIKKKTKKKVDMSKVLQDEISKSPFRSVWKDPYASRGKSKKINQPYL